MRDPARKYIYRFTSFTLFNKAFCFLSYPGRIMNVRWWPSMVSQNLFRLFHVIILLCKTHCFSVLIDTLTIIHCVERSISLGLSVKENLATFTLQQSLGPWMVFVIISIFLILFWLFNLKILMLIEFYSPYT